MQLLKNTFEQNSLLKFITEIGFNNKINFLDVNINNSHEHVVTQPFVKPTNSGIYHNYNSECPLRYKDATIRSMIHRTYKASSTCEIFIQHVNILKQAFINNSYPNCMFDKVLHAFLNNQLEQNYSTPKPQQTIPPPTPHRLLPLPLPLLTPHQPSMSFTIETSSQITINSTNG